MIVVTGGSGKAGRACIQDLLAHQYEVTSVDMLRPPNADVPFSRVDLTDFGQTVEALSGIDERVSNVSAVVHLAAIPAPGLATNA
ncbi:MAG TPA: NAD-dependent epimerase/dehydratase family protein, partial [Chthoniobacterales bacterium]|nr:NAD-dependent epimerase/dehydratase family protein [Chthoniobacterales bacterium]